MIHSKYRFNWEHFKFLICNLFVQEIRFLQHLKQTKRPEPLGSNFGQGLLGSPEEGPSSTLRR